MQIVALESRAELMAREGRCERSATLERGPRGGLSGHAGEQRAHVVVGLVIGAREDALDALVRSQQHVGHVSTSQVRERLKHGLAVWTVHISTLEEYGVDVRVALEVRARALHDCDAAAHAEATLVEREHRAQERARHLAEQLGIVGQPMPSWIRKREHPLAQCHFGKYFFHEVGRRLRHAPAHARRAEPATLAAERDQAPLSAALALQVSEPATEQARAVWASCGPRCTWSRASPWR